MITLPSLEFFIGLDRDVSFTRLSGTLDWTVWSVIRVVCPSLSITKTLAGGDITVNSADKITVKFRVADFAGKSAGTYRYQIQVSDGTLNYSVPLGAGDFRLQAAVT